MSTSSSRNQSRRTSRSGPSTTSKEKDTHKSSSDRRLKAKSTQIETGRRRGSQQTESGLVIASDRPALKSRVNSAPLVRRVADIGGAAGDGTHERKDDDVADALAAVESGDLDAQDEDEVAGVVGAVKHFQPFKTPEVSFVRAHICLRQLTVHVFAALRSPTGHQYRRYWIEKGGKVDVYAESAEPTFSFRLSGCGA